MSSIVNNITVQIITEELDDQGQVVKRTIEPKTSELQQDQTVTLQDGTVITVSPTLDVNTSTSATPTVVEAPLGAVPSNVVTGAGNDTISGGLAADLLNGGNGDDLVSGGKGGDLIYGGAGNDTLYGDKINSSDALISDGNDLIYGGFGNDLIFGGAGDDILDGEDGNDTINGGSGNDLLSGGTGKDSLQGGDGNDTLQGGKGADTVTGGVGNDVFKFSATDTGVDTITDFATGVDKIQLGGFAPDSTVTYDQATGSLKVGGTEVANLGAGTVFDADTVGGADFEII